LSHAGAGRLDIAERLLTRVARTGGRSGNGELGELARQLGRILARAALADSARPPSADEAARLRRLAGELSQAETSTVLLVRADPGARELKVRLAGADKVLLEPDVAAPSLGLYLFRISSAEAPEKLLERLQVSAASELSPSRPLQVRADALAAGAEPALVTRQFSLPSDGKLLALAP
jgi:hypothetical protein